MIRNIAIIAHVDHGKTTLIDAMLRQSGAFRDNQVVQERLMDSNDLEKERGITILAKCTGIEWNGHRINIIDTPGHADFGGEVERVLSMADGVLLLVDSAEGPLPQTKFVLSKALHLGLKPIVVINKIDRQDARPDDVLNEVFDLFVNLEATPEQLDFPILYAVGREGWCVEHVGDRGQDLNPLFERILGHIPAYAIPNQAGFKMLISLLESDPYLGRLLIGKVHDGSIRVNSTIKVLNMDGKTVEQARITKLFGFRDGKRTPVEEVQAGDIACVAGLTEASVTDTLCDLNTETSLPAIPIDPPTMSIMLRVNDSPFAGKEGQKLTSRMIRDRLLAEAEGNIAITVKDTPDQEGFEVGGRGELQLGILIETMRREGFELSVARPHVLYRSDPETGARLEPIEEAVIDVDDDYTGVVIEKLSLRKGELKEMKPSGRGKTRLVFHIPTRGLMGYQGEFLTDTAGTGVLNRLFHAFEPYRGAIMGRRNGVLISINQGEAVAYALWNLQPRGVLFVSPQDPVYEGMIVGEHTRDNDLEVNVLKGKQLTNIRAAGSDENIRLTPARKMTLEEMITYIEDDELIEVTPTALRLRKRLLNPHDRKKASRQAVDV